MAGELLIPLISAGAGLIGVAVGGYFAAFNQKRERQQRFIREQLGEFYGPMLALRAQIRAKSEVRVKIHGAADHAWRKVMERGYSIGIDEVERLDRERFPLFEKILEYNNRQLAEEIMPAYRRMEELWISKMHLAESSTREHFRALTEFVDIWNRWLSGAIPGEVVQQLNHSEQYLLPLYEDLVTNFERLQGNLKE
jgi:hypothetical protein